MKDRIKDKIIIVKNLKKKFKKKVIFRDLSFEVYRGDFLGMVGPNGVGKTVLLHILLGIVLPDGGEIEIFGKELFGNIQFIRSKINYASAYGSLFQQTTLVNNLSVFADLYNVKNKWQKIEKILRIFDLDKFANDQLLESFSDGMRAKAILAKALLSEPEILLLDEPMASLDFKAQRKFSDYLAYLNEEKDVTIIFTSHNVDQIKNFCTRLMILNKGELVFIGGLKEFKSKNHF